MRRIVFFILIVLMSLLMMADASDGVKQTFKIDPGKSASIVYVGVDEDVTVEKHTGNEIIFDFKKEYRGSNSARNTDYFKGIRPEISFEDNKLNIRVKYPRRGFSFSDLFGNFRSRISTRLYVPANIDIDIEVVDGDLDVSGVVGKIALKTVDGDINLRESEGVLNANTVDGDIKVDGVLSQVIGKTVDGDISITFDKGSTLKDNSAFNTVDGDVEINFDDDFQFKLDFKSGDGKYSSGGVHFDRVTLEKENKFLGVKGDGQYSITVRTIDGDFSTRGI